MDRIPADCIVWAVDWNGSLDYAGRCEIRQYTSKGTVPEIGRGSVDCDEVIAKFSIGKEVTAPESAASGYPVGAKVTVNGTGTASSDGSEAKVTRRIAAGTKHPYRIDVANNGYISAWFLKSAIIGQENTTTPTISSVPEASIRTPQSEP